MNAFSYLFCVALCAACISYTITFAGIFSKVRDFIGEWGEWFDELIHCPYCFGHYVVLTIMFTTSDVQQYLLPVTGIIWYDFLFTWFAIICIMSLLHFVMVRAYAPVAENEAFRKLKKG